jgi:hypothetical protein
MKQIEMVLEGNRLLAEEVKRARISSEEMAFRAARNELI